jgi:ribosome-associated protein
MEFTEGDIHINPGVSIPLSELEFRFSRSSGPGGQHVNRSETQVELVFDVANSPSLTEEQRQQAMSALQTRLDSSGKLHLTASSSRSQYQNRQEVIRRFASVMQNALYRRRSRKATKPSLAARERRLEAKRRQSTKKGARQPSGWEE